jgi:hypothetical protein
MLEKISSKFWDRKPYIYFALVAWGCTAFTAQPYFASLFVHFFVFPVMLAVGMWLAHHDGFRRGLARSNKT